uniref:Uncharacterized protein n=1 Tax=Arundo donax TaxID=35708 RepID=A0A0A9EWQ0_ARUDO
MDRRSESIPEAAAPWEEGSATVRRTRGGRRG